MILPVSRFLPSVRRLLEYGYVPHVQWPRATYENSRGHPWWKLCTSVKSTEDYRFKISERIRQAQSEKKREELSGKRMVKGLHKIFRDVERICFLH